VAPMTVTQLLDTTGPAGLWTTAALAAVVLAVLQPAIRRQLNRPLS
jgi:hypothetical protein